MSTHEEYKAVAIETVKHAFRIAKDFEESGRNNPIYIDGPKIAALRKHPDIDLEELSRYLDEIGRQLCEERLFPTIKNARS